MCTSSASKVARPPNAELTLQEEANQQEIDGDADAKHGNGSPLLADAQQQEEVKRKHLQGVIDHMAEEKTRTTTGIGLHPKSETGGSDEIVDETHHVAYSHGHGGERMRASLHVPMDSQAKQQPVNEILQERSGDTHDAEAHYLA